MSFFFGADIRLLYKKTTTPLKLCNVSITFWKILGVTACHRTFSYKTNCVWLVHVTFQILRWTCLTKSILLKTSPFANLQTCLLFYYTYLFQSLALTFVMEASCHITSPPQSLLICTRLHLQRTFRSLCSI